MPLDNNELAKENKKLRIKLKIMQQTLAQFGNIKNSYDGLIKKLEEKDKTLSLMNEKLELLVGERTKELEKK